MRFVSIAVTLISLFVLSGCVSPAERAAMNAEYDAIIERVNKTTPICVDEKDCNAKWDAAQLWVVKNAAYKIQTSTNVSIETYNATKGYGIAVSVTKEPMGGGKYKFVVSIDCGNRYSGCRPSALDATLDFNRTVSAATP